LNKQLQMVNAYSAAISLGASFLPSAFDLSMWWLCPFILCVLMHVSAIVLARGSWPGLSMKVTRFTPLGLFWYKQIYITNTKAILSNEALFDSEETSTPHVNANLDARLNALGIEYFELGVSDFDSDIDYINDQLTDLDRITANLRTENWDKAHKEWRESLKVVRKKRRATIDSALKARVDKLALESTTRHNRYKAHSELRESSVGAEFQALPEPEVEIVNNTQTSVS